MSKTVVLIDDDDDDLEFLRESLECIDASLRCICFTSPVEALRAMSNQLATAPDFVFTDINMPRMTGDEVVQELRKSPEYDQSVIAVWSTSMPDHVSQKLKRLGANYTFQKPSALSILQRLVKSILACHDPKFQASLQPLNSSLQ